MFRCSSAVPTDFFQGCSMSMFSIDSLSHPTPPPCPANLLVSLESFILLLLFLGLLDNQISLVFSCAVNSHFSPVNKFVYLFSYIICVDFNLVNLQRVGGTFVFALAKAMFAFLNNSKCMKKKNTRI